MQNRAWVYWMKEGASLDENQEENERVKQAQSRCLEELRKPRSTPGIYHQIISYAFKLFNFFAIKRHLLLLRFLLPFLFSICSCDKIVNRDI